jgi:activator of HSP90 ATPase
MLIDVHFRLITIFDCKIDMGWKGVTSDGTEVNGTVTVPEVSHEVTVDGLSDYMVSDNRSIVENRHSKEIK